jgi:acetyl esterase/lipase
MNAEKNADVAMSRSAKNPKTPEQRVTPPVVLRLPGMESAKVEENLRYTDVDNPHLLMDVYTPANGARDARLPIVAFLHGGASPQYRPKDWGFFRSWGRLVAASGMVGVAFTHRLGYPKPFFSEASADLSRALEYIRANADSWNADRDRICLAAWSAGGPLLATAMREKPSFVRCLVAFYALLDCQHSRAHTDNESPACVQALSPIRYLQGEASFRIPIFVARAGQDENRAINDSIDRFIAAAMAANAPITLMNHPLGEHGFDNQNDDERSREIIQSAIAFMRAHLK